MKKKKNKPFTFSRVGLPIGAIIDFKREEVFLYEKGEEFSVAGLGTELKSHCTGEVDTLRHWTIRLLTKGRIPFDPAALESKRYWTHRGMLLTEVYDRWKYSQDQS